MAQDFPISSDSNPAGRLAALFDVHYNRLYRLARRLVPSADDALDLVQDTFLRAARSQNSVPAGARNEEAWLVRVLVNIRRDQWRQAAVRKRFNQTAKMDGSEIANAGGNPEAAMIAHATVWKALDLLPPRRRAVIVLHEIEGLEISSIASLLGVSCITIRWHLSRGRKELASVIMPEDMLRKGGKE
jgi:RNA polymerase sigma factor (sigma-70 family)